ncbi:hypothetical protein A2962_04395 [Candidatus Woesebacteria bacterium RIFCSPLOWO2_01_FULL_39_61]|uniref:Uncharacterized protein n=1 Tax=Candidatus Woesebacteria bacterium RIFCSPHIGHO2_02_FULL_39_13 TaxID=1802505 RepID=A0A1F7Z5Z5_9BACT|nr:MAG: hypothetical protein A2692_03520 [Candidatus Woesebacteria bacterium RIFCSPHIGHO2_01_FULL_39_95]OGM34894.1 MAG: hypothetical protein A3D01_00255 [Candidatus Woesebacteria bacterium RIFCSPHIGHO2_02_FULL_39_13]OGM38006.1 MAG: hypothetical protein A3E13_05390 [Candidatus Woesebacteria bacterium RIFCSPHIGHO2_12_FULL_40_20]OGM66622.1 MAG: hypothetical protein A2962_04395 [Candidatus Woesebacteria bacterium RIFCSPLOWO2_01_FULL_39_61]OGM71822.1 MAG: hypothetical protein A3H19_01660 [Candidatus
MKKAASVLLKIILVASIVSLYLGFYYLFNKIEKISSYLAGKDGQRSFAGSLNQENNNDSQEFPIFEGGCNDDCRKEVARLVAEATATLSGTKVVTTATSTTTSPKTAYISMGTTHTTTSTDWVTIEDTAVYIDLENDYGKAAKVSWEASLKVANANGKAFARLWDDTNKIAVDFSELTTTNNADYKQVSSGYVPFWRGRNLYKVQIKSLNSFVITYSGGKVKVSY